MKNAINYYYNLFPNNIHQSDDKKVYFNINNDNYYLLLYKDEYGDVNYLYELSMRLLQNNIFCHQFIPNINNQLVTNVNDHNYILFKVYVEEERQITIDDLIQFFNFTQYIKLDNQPKNYFDLWSQKIDYYEYQITQFGKQFPIIRESFNYYVGLAENALLFYKMIYNDKYKDMVICHRRIKSDDTIFELYNPFNFIVDFKIRSYVEFFKNEFFYDERDIKEDIYVYLNTILNNSYEVMLFFSRLLFPTYYFDLYELIINNYEDEKKILTIINKVNDYEYLLQEIYLYLTSYVNMPSIEWLKKLNY